jgi:hypothetical protein
MKTAGDVCGRNEREQLFIMSCALTEVGIKIDG